MSEISAVVFDLGKVLVRFSFDPVIAFLAKHGADFRDLPDFIEKSEMLAYEHGEIDTKRFFSNINSHLATPAHFDDIAEVWQSIFEPDEEMLSYICALQQKLPTFILSNTGELHWAYLEKTFSLSQRCNDKLASFEVGAMKPSEKIFREAERRFGVKPSRTVFIDDLLANVEGAISAGWKGVHHQEYANTRSALEALGVPAVG